MASVRLEKLRKSFGKTEVIRDIDLEIGEGEFVVFVGPSGCGKSTLLRLIAGLEDASDGDIWIGEDKVTATEPAKRGVSMVFQSYALYPHMTVRKNIGFGLSLSGTAKETVEERVNRVAGMLQIGELLDRRPRELSGGQRQRVAIARAIVREPRVFLFDEPLSNLDAKLRVEMRASLSEMHERLGVTTVYVTHDQVEATTLGHRVAVLSNAKLQQCDTPAALYDSPANLFVAGFIGSPSMNLVPAEISDKKLHFAGHTISLPQSTPGNLPRSVVFGFRPTDLHLDGAGVPKDWPRIEVTADVVEEQGADSIVTFRVDGPKIDIEGKARLPGSDDEATLFADDHRARLAARISGRSRVKGGERVSFAIDANHLYFFDPETGLAIR